MSHIYKGLPRNTIREAGSEIPGHARGWLVPVMEESSQFPVGGRWGIGSCWFFTGKEKGWVKAKTHIQWALKQIWLQNLYSKLALLASASKCWLACVCRSLLWRYLHLPLSLFILCWTIYPWENKWCNSRVTVSIGQVLVMHVKSKAFSFIRLQLALVSP